MEAIVDRPQARFEHVRVDLRGRKVGVTQHHLNRSKVSSSLQQMRRKRMPDDVWAERLWEAGSTPVAFQDLPKADAAERSASSVDEQAGRRAPLHQGGPPITLITPYPCCGLFADRDQPFLIPLTDTRQIVLVKVQVGAAHADQFRDAHSCGVEQLDHRAIAQTTRRRDIGLSDQRVHFFQGEKFRQRRPRPRRPQILRWTVLQVAVEYEETIETADGRHFSSHGSRG
jgi:hypothetical protein